MNPTVRFAVITASLAAATASHAHGPAGTGLFAGLLVGTVLLVVGLTFIPVLALGPILEHLSL